MTTKHIILIISSVCFLGNGRTDRQILYIQEIFCEYSNVNLFYCFMHFSRHCRHIIKLTKADINTFITRPMVITCCCRPAAMCNESFPNSSSLEMSVSLFSPCLSLSVPWCARVHVYRSLFDHFFLPSITPRSILPISPIFRCYSPARSLYPTTRRETMCCLPAPPRSAGPRSGTKPGDVILMCF